MDMNENHYALFEIYYDLLNFACGESWSKFVRGVSIHYIPISRLKGSSFLFLSTEYCINPLPLSIK